MQAALHVEVGTEAVKSLLSLNGPVLLTSCHTGYADTLAQFPDVVKQQHYVPVLPLQNMELHKVTEC